MYKVRVVAVALAGVVAGAAVTPAQALTLDIEGELCHFTHADSELELFRFSDGPSGAPARDFRWSRTQAATHITDSSSLVSVKQKLLDAARAQVAVLESSPSPDALELGELRLKVSKYEDQLEYLDRLGALAQACLDGQGASTGDETLPSGNGNPAPPAGPGGAQSSGSPGSAKVAAELSSPSGQPNAKGMGVIALGAVLALLGLFAAAFPVISPLLPPQLRALLPGGGLL